MCGIAGIWQLGLGGLAEIASEMAVAVRHRGPDDFGVWDDASAGIALAQQRLSIIDLSPAGHQPMLSASGRYVITYNGELYNFPELRCELEAEGLDFRGDSDTEVLLGAIDRWGIDAALDRLIGMFAFALWDRRERELVLVRDRLGIKPLYWGRVGAAFVFASEPKAFACLPGWTGEIDREVLAAYLRWNYVPAPHCIFKGLGKLEPGTILRLRDGGEPRIARFWDFRQVAEEGVRAAERLSDAEAVERCESLLRDAVRRRMLADVPLGAFLSGGIDSSLVVALMQAESARPVKTFTIGFDEQLFNEAPFAKAVARHLGTEHRELYLTPRDAIDVIPDLPSIYDEPFADSSQIPTYLVSRMTRRHVTVALSGDGGDELMAGYTRYRWADMTRRRFGSMPAPLRRATAAGLGALPDAAWNGLAALMPERLSKGRLGDRVGRFCAFLEQPDDDAIYLRQHTQWPSPTALTHGAGEAPATLPDPGLSACFPHFVSRMQVMDSISYLPDDVLTKVDRASMAEALEVRVPLLDHRVVEFGWRLPYEQKYRDGLGKWLLRQVLYRHVPPALVERPKSGFGVPIAAWLRGPIRDWAEALLAPEALADAGLPGTEPIRRAWARLQAGHDRFQEPIWGVLVYQAWHQHQVSTVGRAPARRHLRAAIGDGG
ncbi:MAG: asparagine synthase (glutamine-hydrolyzing) [Alphaproteobacteria bacterium]|jgi:asparagine synthase (glutamine-hydrolysing)|nr:asparagine synthase (glutamine-hydrolyzing) [Alphaproteobacteria bacterium]